VVNNNNGNIAGLTTVTGGTLNGNGGNFTGSVRNNGGTVNINDATTGDIATNSGTTNIIAGAVLTGDVRNTGGTTNNEGRIAGTAAVTAGIMNNNAGNITGLTTVTGGTLNGNGGNFGGAVSNQGGAVNINAATTGDVTNESGATVIAAAGTLTGTMRNEGGTTANNGTIAGPLQVAGGTVRNNTGADVTGRTVVSGGTLNAEGGSFSGGITANNGTVNVNADTQADVTNAGGIVAIDAGTALTGDMLQTAGTTDNSGTVNGTLGLSGGTFNQLAGAGMTGQASVSGTGVLNGEGGSFAGGIENTGGVVNINADTAADVTNLSGLLAIDTAQTLTGNVVSAGEVTSAGTISGDFVNRDGGTFDIGPGTSATVTGIFANQSGGTTTVDAGETLTTGGMTNAANGILTMNGTLGGALTNRGDVTTQGGRFTDQVTNDSTINASGQVNFDGGLAGDGTIDLTRNTVTPGDQTDDVVTVGGTGLSGTTRLAFDVDLGTGTHGSDRVVMDSGAAVTGRVVLAFTTVNAGSTFEGDILLIDVDEATQGTAIEFGRPTGLPNEGDLIIYRVVQLNNTGDIIIRSGTNPGIGALVGSVALTQSLIGSVINRPSSPFVSGLAYEDTDPCGAGAWGRLTGGQATATGSSKDGDNISDTETRASYTGIQLGGDFACFNGYFNGWDLAFGGIAGLNQGKITQPIFSLSSVGSDPFQISQTSGKFQQYYGGVYTTAVKGPFAVDLQYRLEKTDFTVSNEGVGGSVGLGLDDTKFSSKAQTLSGSVSYAFPIKDTAITILPTAGFAWTKTSTDEIALLRNNTVQLQDFENQTLFLGATVARTIISEDGNSAFNQFVTATYYQDFADAPTALFTDAATNTSRTIELDNLGAYGELSVGVNYVRILNPGQIGPARQLNASIRADARMGKQLDSWGITGQVRLQF
jgi:fibronectin-binding autotransporter adhesin